MGTGNVEGRKIAMNKQYTDLNRSSKLKVLVQPTHGHLARRDIYSFPKRGFAQKSG